MKKALVVLLLMTGMVYAQITEYSVLASATPILGSARSYSMGGVFSATNRGIEGLTGNPAGLVFSNGSQFIASGRMRVMGEEGYDTDHYDAMNMEDYSQKNKFGVKLVNVGIAFPIEVNKEGTRLMGAVGYRSYYDLSNKLVTKFTFTGQDEIEEFKSTDTQKGILNVLSFGLGAQINDQFSLGGVFNLPVFSGLEVESEYESNSRQSSGLYSFSNIEKSTFDVSGGGFLHLGAMFNVTPELNLGATYTFAHKFELENGEWSRETESSYGSSSSNDGEYQDIKFEIPSYWSLGVSYLLSPDFVLAGELQNRPWEDVEIEGHDIGDVTESGTTWRIGAEFGQDVKFRIGYFSDRTHLLDGKKDPVNMTGITGGLGFASDVMNVDIGANYRSMVIDKSTNPESSEEYRINDLLIFATLTYGFDFVVGGN